MVSAGSGGPFRQARPLKQGEAAYLEYRGFAFPHPSSIDLQQNAAATSLDEEGSA